MAHRHPWLIRPPGGTTARAVGASGRRTEKQTARTDHVVQGRFHWLQPGLRHAAVIKTRIGEPRTLLIRPRTNLCTRNCSKTVEHM